jgi:hypothetical protein
MIRRLHISEQSRRPCQTLALSCCEQLVHDLLPRKASSHLHRHCLVSSAQERRPTGIFDPAPRTPSDEELRKAQAIREALRRKLLEHTEPHLIPRWVVGAD